MRAIPIIPTLFVAVAVAVMVWLGVWQLGRADEKAALIAEYEAKAANGEIVDIQVGIEEYAYRHVRLTCDDPNGWQAIAGRNRKGRTGYSHRFQCSEVRRKGGTARNDDILLTTYADIGWSTTPVEPDFKGGVVEGVLVRLGGDFKVIASKPMTGLDLLAKPDPKDLPNNHLAYAGQWFFFALTALLIYGFALRARWRKRG